MSWFFLCCDRLLAELDFWVAKVRRRSWKPWRGGVSPLLGLSGGHTPAASSSGFFLKEALCKLHELICLCRQKSSFVLTSTLRLCLLLQVRPICGVWWFPHAQAGAVWPVALSQPGGLLHLSSYRENRLHRLHGHSLLYLHGPKHGWTRLYSRQGCH